MDTFRYISLFFLLSLLMVASSGTSFKKHFKPKNIKESINQFSLDFYETANEDFTDKNMITSPFSIDVLFAMLSMGARGETQKQILDTLYLPDTKSMQSGFEIILRNLHSTKNIKLDIANKIYVKDTYPLKTDFKYSAVHAFSAEVENIDFTDNDKASKTINSWVEEHTNNKIKDLTSPDDFSSDTRVTLVDAVHFKANWKTPFDSFSTYKEDFHLTSTKKTSVDMMHKTLSAKYANAVELNAQVLELPYVGEESALTIFLPNEIEGLKTIENKLQSNDYLDGIFNTLKKTAIRVSIPKFKIETEIDLKKMLPMLGIEDVFNNKSDLSDLSTVTEPLYVSKATQKAFIEVNEEGTEAAAATHVNVSVQSLQIPEFYFTANRPFYFILRNKGVIIFNGKYVGQ